MLNGNVDEWLVSYFGKVTGRMGGKGGGGGGAARCGRARERY